MIPEEKLQKLLDKVQIDELADAFNFVKEYVVNRLAEHAKELSEKTAEAQKKINAIQNGK